MFQIILQEQTLYSTGQLQWGTLTMVQPTPLHKHNVVGGSTYPTVHGSMYPTFYNLFQTFILKNGSNVQP